MALKTWLGEWRGCLSTFPSMSVRSTNRGDVGRVSSTDTSYCDWMCLYWLRLTLDESSRAWKAALPKCCRPRAVFILSWNVIAPLSRPSARWNGFLPRAFFFAGTHFRRASQRTACDQKVEFTANIYVLEHRRLCCQSLHLSSGRTPWHALATQGEDFQT